MLFDGRLSCSLIPLRIPHYPDVVLEVVTLDDHQRYSSATNGSELGLFPRSGSRMSETRSVDGDIEVLRIGELDDHQTMVVRSPSETDRLHGERFEPLFLGMDSTMTLQEQLRQLRYQTQHIQRHMNEVQQKTQQVEQQSQSTQQQAEQHTRRLQQQIDVVLQKAQQSDQQEYYQQVQYTIQHLQERTGEALQKLQQAMLQMQDAQRQMNQRVQTDKNPPAWVWAMIACVVVFLFNNRETKDGRYRQ